jgi:hypothetical protein
MRNKFLMHGITRIGRPRKYKNRTESQRAYRARRKQREKTLAASPEVHNGGFNRPRYTIEMMEADLDRGRRVYEGLLDAAQGNVEPGITDPYSDQGWLGFRGGHFAGGGGRSGWSEAAVAELGREMAG